MNLTFDTDIDALEIPEEFLNDYPIPSFNLKGLKSLKGLDLYIQSLQKMNYRISVRILKLQSMREDIGKLFETNS